MKNETQSFENKWKICYHREHERNAVKLYITPAASRPFKIDQADKLAFQQYKFLTLMESFPQNTQIFPLMYVNTT